MAIVVPTGGQGSPHLVSGQGLTPLAGGRLGQAEGVALGDYHVGVVQQPVDGGGGQGLGHDLVESIWGWDMFVVEDPCWCLQVFAFQRAL